MFDAVIAILYLGAACVFSLVAFGGQRSRWWHPIACLLWPLMAALWLVIFAYVWVMFGNRR